MALEDIHAEANLRLARELDKIDSELEDETKDSLEDYVLSDPYNKATRHNLRALRKHMIDRAIGMAEHLWSPDSPFIRGFLEDIAQDMGETVGIEVPPALITLAMHSAHERAEDASERREFIEGEYATVYSIEKALRQKTGGIRNQKKLYIPRGNSTGELIEAYGALPKQFSLDFQGEKIVDLRDKIERKRRVAERGEVVHLRQMEREYLSMTRQWVRKIINVSYIKNVIFGMVENQMQDAENILRALVVSPGTEEAPARTPVGNRMYITTWTLDKTHPVTDICDVCGRYPWVHPSRRAYIIERVGLSNYGTANVAEWPEPARRMMQRIEDAGWSGVLATFRPVPREGTVVIKELAETMSHERIKELILQFHRNPRCVFPNKAPDTRTGKEHEATFYDRKIKAKRVPKTQKKPGEWKAHKNCKCHYIVRIPPTTA